MLTELLILAGLVLMSASSLQAQAIYSGPAFGSISGGASVSTGSFSDAPETVVSVNKKLIHNPFWDKFNPPLADDALNRTPAAGPAGSNEVLASESVSQPPVLLTSFEGPDMGSSIPPDPILAVGPNHIIAMVNTEFAIYDKQGNLLFSRSADQWFANVSPYNGLFDPIVMYDNLSERWIQCWDLQDDNNQTGYWLVSISDDSDPMGTWMNYSFPAHLNGSTPAGNWGDYQKVGYDHQAVYLSGRQFSFGGGFNYCKVRIISKAELYDPAGGPVNYTDFWNFRDPNNPGVLVDGPPIAAAHLDSTDNKAYIIVDSPYNNSTFVTLWTISDPLGSSPGVSATNIPTLGAYPPPDALQLGGGSPRIDSGRRAYRNPVYRDGKIWVSTAVAGGSGFLYAFGRYLKIDVNSNSIDEDVTFGEDGSYYLYPAVMPDADDNVILTFTRSGSSEYAGAAFAGRQAGDPPGISPSDLMQAGGGNYVVTFGGTRNRWGDYMGIALDPAFPNTVWAIAEYAKSINQWSTWIGALTYSYFGVRGLVKDAVSGDPIYPADIEVVELSRTVNPDPQGNYLVLSPVQDLTFNVSAFAYQDRTLNLSLAANDTDVVDIELQPEVQATFAGKVIDPQSGNGVEATIEFYAHGNPNPGPYATTTTDGDGNFSISTIIGEYDLDIYPASPYAFTEVDGQVLDTGGLNVNLEVMPAMVLLVDDDDGSSHERYYRDGLAVNSYSYHLWNVQNSGYPTLADMNAFPDKIAIWYTGDSDGNSLSSDEANELHSFLNGGGRLLLTGQDIAEENSGHALLTTLGADFALNSTQTVVLGVAGDIAGGLVLLTSGTTGANNQTSKDQLTITDTTTTRSILTYSANPAAVAGVAFDNGNTRAVFIGFGWEGIGDPDRRNTLLQNVLTYIGGTVGIEAPADGAVAETFALYQNYPNPFNPSTTIAFALPLASQVEVAVYNTLGQKVRVLTRERYSAGVHRVVWDGKDEHGTALSSGIYFYRLQAGDQFRSMRKMLLVK